MAVPKQCANARKHWRRWYANNNDMQSPLKALRKSASIHSLHQSKWNLSSYVKDYFMRYSYPPSCQ